MRLPGFLAGFHILGILLHRRLLAGDRLAQGVKTLGYTAQDGHAPQEVAPYLARRLITLPEGAGRPRDRFRERFERMRRPADARDRPAAQHELHALAHDRLLLHL